MAACGEVQEAGEARFQRVQGEVMESLEQEQSGFDAPSPAVF